MTEQEATNIKVYFDAVAPAMASDTRYTVFLDLASDRVDRGYFGASWTKAMAYMTAHLMEMSNRNGSESGTVTSRREGDISVSYAASQQNDGDLYLTTYGKLFLALLNSLSAGAEISGTGFTMQSWGHC